MRGAPHVAHAGAIASGPVLLDALESRGPTVRVASAGDARAGSEIIIRQAETVSRDAVANVLVRAFLVGGARVGLQALADHLIHSRKLDAATALAVSVL